eukprot:NODE_5288_length_595_cov_251.342593.p2 GENE.NODE_5288_length_595_cov_251.342593~~NODE_5288_length_595_cov_251.342593.p2  ORF type:complete len:87 (-),score=21.90 NODE_5288_length_595_cov_251.342593:159-419(-)
MPAASRGGEIAELAASAPVRRKQARVSVTFLLLLGIAALLETEVSWKAEPIVAMILAVLVSIEGCRVIYVHAGSVEVKLQSERWVG